LHLILCEPNPHTLNIDSDEISRRMTNRTRAVLVTHMNGLPADMSAIGAATEEAAARLGIAPPWVLVDAARACGAATPMGPVGCEGWLTMFSFHRKKLMTTLGQGGMLVTACEATARRLRQLRSFGEGQVWGSNYRMTEFQAAVGRVQLRRLDHMNDRRIAHARARSRMLSGVSGLELPPEPGGYRHVFYLYNLVFDPVASPGARDRLMQRLHHNYGVGAVVANRPTYQSHELIRVHTSDQGPFPVAEGVAARLLCPALHPQMTEQENAHVANAIVESLAAVRSGSR
jgi:dTDP-4-amino-4,6-dideoxygalactose transaminase